MIGYRNIDGDVWVFKGGRMKVATAFNVKNLYGVWVINIVVLLVLVGVMISVPAVQSAEARGMIYIRSDGSVDPSTAPIQRNGNTYTLTDDFNGSIVVEGDNIVIDGAGHVLQGPGGESIGVNLTNVNNVTVKNLEIRNFFDGIRIRRTFLESGVEYRYKIVNNTILECERGVFVFNALNVTITGNTIINCDKGIRLWCTSNLYGTQNIISENNITWTHLTGGIVTYGILMGAATYNYIFLNNISKTWIAIEMSTSYYNYIFNNSIFENKKGIIIDSSTSNKIYSNNFIDNEIQAEASENYWNSWDNGYPLGGNYWSDYEGVDERIGPYQNESGIDGIGDTPYIINEDNIDHYPLMKPIQSIYARPPTFVITDLNVSSNIVEIDQTVTISVNVTNTGDREGSCTINLKINNVTVDSKNVTLMGKESKIVAFSWTAKEPGIYVVEIAGLKAEIKVKKPAMFVFTDLKIDVAKTEVGRKIVVTVNVTNIGESKGSYIIELRVNGTVVDFEDVTLPAGGSKIVTLEWNVTEPGTYSIKVTGFEEPSTVHIPPPTEETVQNAEQEHNQLPTSLTWIIIGTTLTTITVTLTIYIKRKHCTYKTTQ